MFLAPLLKLRDKVTNKRKALTHDTEKPFLEHLDDLRTTLTRMIITLVIAVVACFYFNKLFFDVIRDPLRRAGLDTAIERNLPSEIANLEKDKRQPAWWRIHRAARGATALEGEHRAIFFKMAAPDDLTKHFAQALLIYHTETMLPDDVQKDYRTRSLAFLPETDRSTAEKYVQQLFDAKTGSDLDVPLNTVETEAFAPAESFMLSMKLALFAGIIVSFPLLFYFLLEFILPGLTGRERKLIFPALGIGFGLFLAGVLFAFFFVIPRALEFFHETSAEYDIKDHWRIGMYVSFVTTFSLIFGLAFETPVVIMVMVKLGLLTSTTMRRTRAWAVIILMISSAVLTPTGDMFTMSLLAAPMIIMYEACIWLAVLHERKERRKEAEEQRRDQARRAALIGVASVQAAGTSDPQETTDNTGATEPETPAETTGEGLMQVLPDHDVDHPHHSSGVESSDAHPHHPEPAAPDADTDYEQYLRDHAHLYTPAETHIESIAGEDRVAEKPAEPPVEAPPESPVKSPGETPVDAPAAGIQEAPAAETPDTNVPTPSEEKKDGDTHPGPM